MKTLLAFCLLMSAFSLKAQNTDYALEHYNLKDGLAIQGYDPVAYFTSNKAIKGQESIEYTFEKVTYRFSSEANKKLFVASPDKYKPAYGGYCAYAIAFGDKVKINPETFKVKDGKLFLFYNFRRTNTLTKWNKDEPNLYSKANKAWNRLTLER